MRRLGALSALIPLAVAAISLLFGSAAFAASYQRTDGTIVDPIQSVSDYQYSYSLVNLAPGANLISLVMPEASLVSADLGGADLTHAVLAGSSLIDADLSNANLHDAFAVYTNLDNANLSNANLSNAHLSFASLVGANLTGAIFNGASFNSVCQPGLLPVGCRPDLSGAILTNAGGLSSTNGFALYDINTDFTGTGFDPVAAGWTLVPEPSTALLLGLGLTALAVRRGQ